MVSRNNRLLSSLLGAVALMVAPLGAAANHPEQWTQSLRDVFDPSGAVTTTISVAVKGTPGTPTHPSLSVEVSRSPQSDGSYALVARVVEPFDARGTIYWVEPTKTGTPRVWVYVPALRRTKEIQNEAWVHPGLRTLFRMDTYVHALDWSQAHLVRTESDGKRWIHLTHRLPGSEGWIEATLDAERNKLSRLTVIEDATTGRVDLRFQLPNVAQQSTPAALRSS